MKKVLDTVRRVWARVRALEPARVAEGVRVVLTVAVAAGWLTVDDARVNTAATLAAAVVSMFATRKVRAAVTPTAKLDGCTAVRAADREL